MTDHAGTLPQPGRHHRGPNTRSGGDTIPTPIFGILVICIHLQITARWLIVAWEKALVFFLQLVVFFSPPLSSLSLHFPFLLVLYNRAVPAEVKHSLPLGPYVAKRMSSSAFKTATDTLTYAVPHLAGAIDILAVLQPDGSLKVSPFYVRFGKYSSLRSSDKDKRVHISINDVPQSYSMQLGRTGEAYFIEEVEQELDADGATARSLSEEVSSYHPLPVDSPPDGASDDDEQPHHDHDHDRQITPLTLKVRRSISLPTLSTQHNNGNKINIATSSNPTIESAKLSEALKGLVNESSVNPLDLSLCWLELKKGIFTSPEEVERVFEQNKLTPDTFDAGVLNDERLACRLGTKVISFASAMPLIIHSLAFGAVSAGERVLKECDMQEIFELPENYIQGTQSHMSSESLGSPSSSSVGGMSPRSASWREWLTMSWSSSSPVLQDEAKERHPKDAGLGGTGLSSRIVSTLQSSPSKHKGDTVPAVQEAALLTAAVQGQASHVNITEVGRIRRSASGRKMLVTLKRRAFVPAAEHMKELLAACLMVPGGEMGSGEMTTNVVTFRFGKSELRAYLYLVRWDHKLVVSDVDGTITKSDVLGHLGQLLGYDWTHSGVAGLFNAIAKNGYSLLYLSSRSIAQASVTRDYLHSLRQDGFEMPRGPVIISPDGLFPSLYREVVLRRPHEFKIRCLEDIKSLFPKDWMPFVAGFGNRDTDEESYLAVGIPPSRIFIINPKGELRQASSAIVTSSLRSLPAITSLVDSLFPDVERAGGSKFVVGDLGEEEEKKMQEPPLKDEFNDHAFWKLGMTYVIDEEEDELFEDAVGPQ